MVKRRKRIMYGLSQKTSYIIAKYLTKNKIVGAHENTTHAKKKLLPSYLTT